MKRKFSILLSAIALLYLCACSKQELIDMTTEDNGDYLAIIWEDRVYVPFCVVSKKDAGEQIGYLSGDKDDRVCEYEGESPEEWVVNSLTVDGGAILYKEENVIDIPDGLESEYEWNN